LSDPQSPHLPVNDQSSTSLHAMLLVVLVVAGENVRWLSSLPKQLTLLPKHQLLALLQNLMLRLRPEVDLAIFLLPCVLLVEEQTVLVLSLLGQKHLVQKHLDPRHLLRQTVLPLTDGALGVLVLVQETRMHLVILARAYLSAARLLTGLIRHRMDLRRGDRSLAEEMHHQPGPIHQLRLLRLAADMYLAPSARLGVMGSRAVMKC